MRPVVQPLARQRGDHLAEFRLLVGPGLGEENAGAHFVLRSLVDRCPLILNLFVVTDNDQRPTDNERSDNETRVKYARYSGACRSGATMRTMKKCAVLAFLL